MNIALSGAGFHDGTRLQEQGVLVVSSDGTAEWRAQLPEGCREVPLEGGVICPGFVDLQVNGGGGVMFGAPADVGTLERMIAAHRTTGTAAILPTLITDTPEQVSAAIATVSAACRDGMPGILGLHLEGPHLSLARKGAHDARLIRPMEAADLRQLCLAAETIPNLVVTLAPESVTDLQIAELVRAGVLVSLGHSDVGYDRAMAAFDAGARMATHLFNAMSPLTSRAPGLVGATLDHGAVHAGIIADTIHVHPATLRLALAAKAGPGTLFLVSDAMAPAGTTMESFELGGRRITRGDGRLTLADGTLAGADLSMARAVRVMKEQGGAGLERALNMATGGPAGLLRAPMGYGGFQGRIAGLIHFDPLTGQARVLSELISSRPNSP